jgi:hypothetical protein
LFAPTATGGGTSDWPPRPPTPPLAASSPDQAGISDSTGEAQFPDGYLRARSPLHSGSSLEEDREVFRLVGGGGNNRDGDDCSGGDEQDERKSSLGSGSVDDAANPRFKTEICRNFKEKGTCLYGHQCQFAHGSDEMRDSGKQNKYKTKLCQKYWIHGYCAYGARCNFLHNEDEARSGGGGGSALSAVKRRKANSFSINAGGGGGDQSAEPLDLLVSPRSRHTSGSGGGSMQSTALPPLSALQRPRHGSGRLAAYSHNNNYTWIDTWTKKIVN